MKQDLDRLMEERSLDAAFVSGTVHGNPAMVESGKGSHGKSAIADPGPSPDRNTIYQRGQPQFDVDKPASPVTAERPDHHFLPDDRLPVAPLPYAFRFDGREYRMEISKGRASYSGQGFDIKFEADDIEGTMDGEAAGEVDLTFYHIMDLLRRGIYDPRQVNYLNCLIPTEGLGP